MDSKNKFVLSFNDTSVDEERVLELLTNVIVELLHHRGEGGKATEPMNNILDKTEIGEKDGGKPGKTQ